MDQILFNRIVKLLTVTSAFSSYTDLYNSINWDGAADEFTVRLVQKFKIHGELEPGYPALVNLLQIIYDKVGIQVDGFRRVEPFVHQTMQFWAVLGFSMASTKKLIRMFLIAHSG